MAKKILILALLLFGIVGIAAGFEARFGEGILTDIESFEAPDNILKESAETVVIGTIESFQVKALKRDNDIPEESRSKPDMQALADEGVHIARWRVRTEPGDSDLPSVIHVVDYTLDFIQDNDNQNPLVEGRKYRLYLDPDHQRVWGGFVLLAFEDFDEDDEEPSPDTSPTPASTP